MLQCLRQNRIGKYCFNIRWDVRLRCVALLWTFNIINDSCLCDLKEYECEYIHKVPNKSSLSTVKRTKLCRSELPAKDEMRKYNAPRPFFLPRNVPILRHCNGFVTNFSVAVSALKNCSALFLPLISIIVAPTRNTIPMADILSHLERSTISGIPKEHRKEGLQDKSVFF
ncbi:hypothetical protein EVAR_71219_1 [Eumeta japonica]|uniref:Uncharacterized protein n=1 Tax=Eumeta variegata TaxID=151549 RepID=A0A4C2A951_EUMVA|nr:hypothetical protein EVAR_71219_1 [Eumeta japonica]